MLSKLYFKRKFKGGDWQGSDTVLSADFADLECEASAKSRYWACVNSNTYGNNDRIYVRKKLAFKKGVWYDKSRTNVRQDGRRQNLMLIQENLSIEEHRYQKKDRHHD